MSEKKIAAIARQVIVDWYVPAEKHPEEDIAVVATISGRTVASDRGEVLHFDHAIVILFWDFEMGWYSTEYDFDLLIVHAWCDLDPYMG